VKVDISSSFGGEDNERIDCSSVQVDGAYRKVVHCSFSKDTTLKKSIIVICELNDLKVD
jgi:hypothetical protein